MGFKRKHIKIIVTVVVVVILFAGGFFIGKQSSNNSSTSSQIFFNRELGKPAPMDFSPFWQALKVLEDKYVNSDKIDYQNLLYGAIEGMTNSLGDDYTVFMKPEKTDSFMQSVSGKDSFEGVGMELGLKEKVLTVVAPLEGTPAFKAGIKAGDKILKIDDKTTEGMQTEEAVGLIRGKKGTTVVLSIIRSGFQEPKIFSLVRDNIEIPVMRWEMRDNDIAYIKIYQFTSNLPDKFKDAVSGLLKNNAKKIIIDLRNNPGGYLETAVDIVSWFNPKGSVVLKEEFKNGEGDEYVSRGYSAIADLPVVVLVNKGSASASEIMAGALRDIRGIKLVGEITFGKGSVQTVEKFRDGSSLKVTIAKWLTPSGVSINEEGLKPDFEIEYTDEDYSNNRDPQLDKAIELLSK
ncbi:MAG: S41 family peptidase [Patescibacteria group bacterium]